MTFFVFLMGLLFKVDGVTLNSPAYNALSAAMLTLCAAFLTAWGVTVLYEMVRRYRDVVTAKPGAGTPAVPAAAGIVARTASHRTMPRWRVRL